MTSAHSILPLLSTLLLLYSAATTAVSGRPTPVPVLDTDGNPVLSGTKYYITGALHSNGYGLQVIHLNDTCRNNVELALPKFGPMVVLYRPPGNETVNVNENVRIASLIPALRICHTNWWVDEQTGLLTVGAFFWEENNRPFRIVRHEIPGGHYYYKILFCSDDGSLCHTLGVNEQLLGLNAKPLIVQFKKAAEVSKVSAAMHSTA